MDRVKIWMLVAWLTMTFGAIFGNKASSIQNKSSSSAYCKFKHHRHPAIQVDPNGRKCWDEVTIQSCGGYCKSHEVAHWQFPYKQSFHPVCVHGERRHASVKLRNCDPGVDPRFRVYHYLEAASCRCQVCSSENTSCEWLPPDTKMLLLSELVRRKEEIVTENENMID